MIFRSFNAYLLLPMMALTGFRFTRCYRRGDTLRHRFIYMLVDTIRANGAADELAPFQGGE